MIPAKTWIHRMIRLSHSLRVGSIMLELIPRPQCQISSLRSQVSGLRSRVSGLKSQVSGLGSQVSGLGSRVSGLKSQVLSLGSRVSGREPPVLVSSFRSCFVILHVELETRNLET